MTCVPFVDMQIIYKFFPSISNWPFWLVSMSGNSIKNVNHHVLKNAVIFWALLVFILPVFFYEYLKKKTITSSSVNLRKKKTHFARDKKNYEKVQWLTKLWVCQIIKNTNASFLNIKYLFSYKHTHYYTRLSYYYP